MFFPPYEQSIQLMNLKFVWEVISIRLLMQAQTKLQRLISLCHAQCGLKNMISENAFLDRWRTLNPHKNGLHILLEDVTFSYG